MHFRFRGNPNTNEAARLAAHNKQRMAKGLPPLTMKEWEGNNGKGALVVAAPLLPPPAKKPLSLF